MESVDRKRPMADLSCESSGDLPLSALSKNPFLSPGNPAKKKRFPVAVEKDFRFYFLASISLLSAMDRMEIKSIKITFSREEIIT